MTNGSTDRLDRVEALLAQLAEAQARSQQASDERLTRIETICDSNARSIQAWESRIEEGIAEAEEVSTSMAANSNRELRESISDVVSMISDLGEQQAETDRRFNILLEEARADRQANADAHRAFTETIQTLLAEIARLWQRLQAG